MVDLTLRETKGSVLTHAEMDTNLVNLKNAVNRSVNINKGLLWSAGTYTYGSLVRYNGIAYICDVESTDALPTDTNSWKPVGKGTYSVPELTDVALTNPSNSDVLSYDAASNNWVNKKIKLSFRMNFSGILEPVISNVRYYPVNNISIKSFFITLGLASNVAGSVTVNKSNSPVLIVPIGVGVDKINLTPFILPLTTDEYLTVNCNMPAGKDLSMTFIYE
jgi:hypothetical protein